MNAFSEKLACLLQEKIFLYQEMAECLKKEQKILLTANVDSLWDFSDKKQSITLKIEDVRDTILTILGEMDVDHDMNTSSFKTSRVLSLLPENISKKLRKLETSLNVTKKGVQEFARQNKGFVVEYLQVIDEMMETITSVQKQDEGYTNGRYPGQKSQTSMFLSREA